MSSVTARCNQLIITVYSENRRESIIIVRQKMTPVLKCLCQLAFVCSYKN